jgi:hypothetical protein
MHQPLLAFQRRRRIRVERFMSMEEDAALLVQELQCVETDASEFLQGGELRVGPLL